MLPGGISALGVWDWLLNKLHVLLAVEKTLLFWFNFLQHIIKFLPFGRCIHHPDRNLLPTMGWGTYLRFPTDIMFSGFLSVSSLPINVWRTLISIFPVAMSTWNFTIQWNSWKHSYFISIRIFHARGEEACRSDFSRAKFSDFIDKGGACEVSWGSNFSCTELSDLSKLLQKSFRLVGLLDLCSGCIEVDNSGISGEQPVYTWCIRGVLCLYTLTLSERLAN